MLTATPRLLVVRNPVDFSRQIRLADYNTAHDGRQVSMEVRTDISVLNGGQLRPGAICPKMAREAAPVQVGTLPGAPCMVR